ncbi:hypothetical protein JW826_05000 [Candidatus Woesearchaeota archaeon]|nr:hypothetical protein [Candidatus Woesearchaeota archaeon]
MPYDITLDDDMKFQLYVIIADKAELTEAVSDLTVLLTGFGFEQRTPRRGDKLPARFHYDGVEAALYAERVDESWLPDENGTLQALHLDITNAFGSHTHGNLRRLLGAYCKVRTLDELARD